MTGKSNPTNGMTRKDIVAATGVPPYLVKYYSDCGYLPILRESNGPGHPIIYDHRAVEISMQRFETSRSRNRRVTSLRARSGND